MKSFLFPALLVCLPALSSLPAADKDLPVPKGAPVNKSKATVDKAGNLVVDVVSYVSVSVTRIVRMGDEEKKVVETRKIPVLKKRVLAKGAFQVFDAQGKSVSGMALPHLLESKQVHVIQTDAMKPTDEQLRKLGADALLVFEQTKKAAKPSIN